MLTLYADFETTIIEPVRVWLWACSDGAYTETGTDIIDFLRYVTINGKAKIYFHNLRFDGSYILSYLLKNGYTHTTAKKLQPNQLSLLMSRMGQMYQIRANIGGTVVTFVDSLKIMPVSIRELGDMLGYGKGDCDFDKPRPIGYAPTQEEIDYCIRDVEIMRRGVEIAHEYGINKLTVGASALDIYRHTVDYAKLFPKIRPEWCADMRRGYTGGYVGLKEAREYGPGKIYDIRSMYPWALLQDMPYGAPVIMQKYQKSDKHLYLWDITIDAKLRQGPAFIAKSKGFYGQIDYISDTEGFINLLVTGNELELIKQNYDILDITYNYGYKFRRAKLFESYIHQMFELKNNAPNKVVRLIAKLLLNALYGKFGKNPDVTGKIPVLGDDGILRYDAGEEEITDSNYLPIAIFTTSYARIKLISTITDNYDAYRYSDTDSIHTDASCEIECGDNVGDWELEAEYDRAKYIRRKSYAYEVRGKSTIKCAGLGNDTKSALTIDTFVAGNYTRKVMRQAVGGAVIIDRVYTLSA